MDMKVIKRKGQEVPFLPSKIYNAIEKAWRASQSSDMHRDDIQLITDIVCEDIELAGKQSISVEEIQDMVEHALMDYGYNAVAKKYILYRAERTKIRQSENYLMNIFQQLTFEPAADSDMKRENANIDGNTAMGTMLKYGSESSKFFIDNYVLPADIAKAHIEGDIHIHDKDFYMLTETCCQIDLIPLFQDGFSTGHGFLREPQSIISAAALACIVIQANQNEMHGGQSLPNFDFAMAKYVSKTFRKEYERELKAYFSLKFNIQENYVQTFLDALRETLSLSNQDSYTREFYNNLPATVRGGVSGKIIYNYEELFVGHTYAIEKALKQTDRLTYQAMEALVHNLNTLHSRCGAQVPFSSLNYGTDTSPEGRMVIKNLLLATQAGLGNGETPIFPVQIFKVKEGVSYNEGDPNYDLFKLAMETSAKRLFPNFSFLDAPFNIKYYRKGDYNGDVCYMGCRTRVISNVYDPTREVTCGRGNLSFTTINLPRLALEAGHDITKFYAMLDNRLDLVHRQLLHRLKIQSARHVYNYPFLMGNGVWLDSDKLDWDDTVGEVLKHGTLTIGFIGLAECLKALIGAHHGESNEAQKLGLEIIGRMRKYTDQKSQEMQLNWGIIGTPAEGLSGRFVPLDRERYGTIEGITDREYYTNSFHIPVYYPIAAYKKIQLEAPYHALTNAGHITYIEMDGDPSRNLQAFEKVIRYMHDCGVGYGSINHPVDRDPVCGYVGIINDVCPRCGRREGEGITIEKLKELQQKYPDVPNWKE